MQNEIILEMKGISKSFPGVKALDNVDLTLHKGEVLALLGENGAGKSTLIKILSGDYVADEGTIMIGGETITRHDPHTMIASGVGVIYQELNNSDPLSIAENIFMGNLPMKGLVVNSKKLREDTKEMLRRVGLTGEDPDEPLGRLSIAKKQMVEIAKALSHEARILVMDEPTAALNDEEIDILFDLVRKLSEEGTSVIYISHRLDEVFVISDNIMVMRDGRHVGDFVTAKTTKKELIASMVGHEIENLYPERTTDHIGKELFRIEGYCSDYIKEVSFDVRQGEIVGLFGLMGAGRTETVEMIIGDRKKTAGRTYVNGQEVTINSPQDAKKYGIGYLPADRKKDGLFLVHSVADNISINVLNQILSNLKLVNTHKDGELASKWIKKLQIKTPGNDVLAKTLSGGNQQKVVVAKWLAAEPKLLIVNEPTRGIDVGAKAEIYNLLNDLSKEGLSIIMVSSELPEIMAMADRIFVLHEGRFKGVLHREEYTQEKLLATAIGG